MLLSSTLSADPNEKNPAIEMTYQELKELEENLFAKNPAS
jgi:hypothetical protein